ncbi:MAG: PPC domain-containing protein [Myxococcales bacterium]|nr:PPC domain-containing protein [Myxococcales bacterium]MCB9579772.1 PPC domain-containing protein [Polyangiaceae bacterium]
MKGSAIFTGLVLLSTTLAVGCSTDTAAPVGGGGNQQLDPSDLVKPEEGKADASYLGVFLEFEFDAEVLVSGSWGVSSKIEDQLLYTIGHLNGEKAVGRLDKLEITNVQTSSEGGNTLVKYHAKLPVAWGRKDAVPETYTLKIPRDGTFTGYESFTEKYKHDCVEWGAHDVDTGSMWYYYRPNNSSCHLEEADVVTTVATVKPSGTQTTGKYPEYDQVWKDDLFKVVAIFGKYEDGATSASDAGISAYNEFVKSIKSRLSAHQLTTTPAQVPTSPGVEMPDITFEATLADGKKVQVTTLLVDNVRTAGYAFDKRYEELSGTADFIVYNGHAGLGANIRALAQKGKWVQGQYAVVFMNGCDTYAYVDSELWDDHAAVNPDDPKGTKYLDIVTNAMPAYFRSDAGATMAFVNGLLSYEQPKTYEQIFKEVDGSQIILVSGEEDNAFVPGGGGGTPEAWEGMNESGSVAKNEEIRYATPTLTPGRYRFDMDGDSDADLYVRVGEAPEKNLYDCRPYKYGSKESCEVEITTPAPVHVMVRGWASSSSYTLAGSPE